MLGNVPVIAHQNRPIQRFLAPFKTVVRAWYREIKGFIWTQPNPDMQALKARRIARVRAQAAHRIETYAAALTAAQRAAQDLTMRTESLLNQCPKNVDPQNLPNAFEKVRALVDWRHASITHYSHLIDLDLSEEQQNALRDFEHSYDTLRKAAENDDHEGAPAYVTHATSMHEAICNLPNQRDKRVVRYAGAFGKKQLLPQLLLSFGDRTLNSLDTGKSLPKFIQDASRHDALGSVQALFAHGFDILLSKLLHADNVDEALNARFDAALNFLQPLLPNNGRASPLSKLPNCLQGNGRDPVQQGLLLSLLDLIPNSQAALRDQCVDAIEKMARLSPEARREQRPACLLKWKALFAQTVAAQFPLALIDNINDMLEEQLTLQLEGVHSGIAELITGQLFSYGTYWLEVSYNHEEETYSLKIHASGAGLTEPDYPRNGDRPLWPIHITGLSSEFPTMLLPWLKKLSATTALTKGWMLPQKDLHPLTASALFGNNGLVALLERMGGQIVDNPKATIPPTSALFSQADMVSHYVLATRNPSYLRYKALRKALLQACAPFARAPVEGVPPVLDLPRGQAGDEALHLFQIAADALHLAARRGNVDAQGLREIDAFKRQLDLANEARSAEQALAQPHTHNSDESLGILVDSLLQAMCPTDEMFEKYHDLFLFLFGDDSERFIGLLRERAGQLRQDPQAAAAGNAAPHAPASVYIPRHPKGWMGQALNSLPAHMLWQIASLLLYLTKTSFSLLQVLASKTPQSIQIELKALFTFLMDSLREKLFAWLFPKLRGKNFLKNVHDAIRQGLPVVNTQVPPNLPTPLSRAPQLRSGFQPQQPNREEIPYPASNEQIQRWCMPWAHFCPASSTDMFVNTTTGRPICRMPSLKLNFTTLETEEGAKWVSVEFPGFWIATEQTVPFGLLLENIEGKQQLLLPSHSLYEQALYMQLSPILGVLGHLAQRKLSSTGTNYYQYERTETGWRSKDPAAMVHLLLLYFARQEIYQIGTGLLQLKRPPHFRMEQLKQDMLQTGEHLLQMPFPAEFMQHFELELHLLPLIVTLDSETQILYARLLAKIAVIPVPEQAPVIPVPKQAPRGRAGMLDHKTQLLTLMSIYQTLVRTKSTDLSNEVLAALFNRYQNVINLYCDTYIAPGRQRLLEKVNALVTCSLNKYISPRNRELVSNFLSFIQQNSPISIKKRQPCHMDDWIAMQPLPWTIQERVRALKANSGVAPSPIDCGISALRLWNASAPQPLLTHPLAVQAIASQGGGQYIESTLRLAFPHFTSRAIRGIPRVARTLFSLLPGRHASLSFEELNTLSAGMLPGRRSLAPESLSETTLIPEFFNYLEMAQGTYGASKQAALTHELCALQFCAVKDNKKLSQMLLRVAEHPQRYAVYDQLRNSGELRDPARILRTFASFNKIQPHWDVVQSTAMLSIYLISSFWLLPAVSGRVINSTIYLIAPQSSRSEMNGLTVSLALAVTVVLLQSSKVIKNTRVPEVCHHSLVRFNHATGMHVTARSLSATAKMAFMLFGMQCLAYFTYQALFASSSSISGNTLLINPNDPNAFNFDPLMTTAMLITYLPIIRYLYNGFHIVLIAQNHPSIHGPKKPEKQTLQIEQL